MIADGCHRVPAAFEHAVRQIDPLPRRPRPAYVEAMWIEADHDPALGELTAAEDADELCRLLLRSPWGWGSSTRHGEAVDLLRRTHGRGTLPGSFLALLLCTCHRWDRVTAKLVAAIEACGLLNSAELDELAESLLSDEVVVEFPLAWVSERWVEIDPADGTTRSVTVAGETVTHDQRRLEPPLRRWAAARALHRDPARLAGLLKSADALPPRHRDALLHGMLDAADTLEAGDRRELVQRALRSGIARVRRTALDRLCELDGAQAALRHARRDADRTVRAWHPPSVPTPAQPQLPGTAPSP
ncbi:MAG TPA: hypothetical protein VMV92_37080 [Streptosporangiaceae bacterium]|nr:hypothetical protein [Streptosporangiaceae bacterium]